jgi:hypothetical protein
LWSCAAAGGGSRRKATQEGKLFFSEEKKQKTLIFPPRPRLMPWPGFVRRRQNKSLFASFSSEKEDSSYRVSSCGTNPHPNPAHVP